MSNAINRWIFKIPLSDIQSDDYDEGVENACICCGKVIKKPKYWVHLVDNGSNLVSSEDDFEGDMGVFMIGTACKNKLPNNFYFK